MPPTVPWRGAAARRLRHPRVALALKAALAASASWLIAVNLPDPAQDYAFYAPFGAIAAMYPTVVSSVRQSLQSVAAIALGAAIALLAEALLGHGLLVVTLAVGVGVLVGGLSALGEQRVYVPVAALFVLVLGQDQEVPFAASYAGLFLLGAAVAIAVNAAFPALPIPQADAALDRLRTALDAHLRYLADRLGADADEGPATPRGPGRPELTAPTSAARRAVEHAHEAVHGNRRARRLPGAVEARLDAFRSLERVVLLVDDLYALLEDAPWGQDVRRAPRVLRDPMARALTELGTAVSAVGLREANPEQRAAVDAAISELTTAMREHGPQGGTAEALVVSTVVTTLRRCLSVVTPADLLAPGPGS